MAEKQTFVQIVDQKTGMVERVADMKEIMALSIEDKLALARNKTLYVVSHKLEPIIKVEMRKIPISTPVAYNQEPVEQPQPVKVEQPKQEVKPLPKTQPKAQKAEKQAEIPMKPAPKGKPKKKK